MRKTNTVWTCNRCKKDFDPEELIQSQTDNVYLQRGVGRFARTYQIRDITGDHIGEDIADLCASCAELVERVITGTGTK